MGLFIKFVWAVYGGDLIGFCQSFRKVFFKNDQQQQQTKSKKSQKVPGYELNFDRYLDSLFGLKITVLLREINKIVFILSANHLNKF